MFRSNSGNFLMLNLLIFLTIRLQGRNCEMKKQIQIFIKFNLFLTIQERDFWLIRHYFCLPAFRRVPKFALRWIVI